MKTALIPLKKYFSSHSFKKLLLLPLSLLLSDIIPKIDRLRLVSHYCLTRRNTQHTKCCNVTRPREEIRLLCLKLLFKARDQYFTVCQPRSTKGSGHIAEEILRIAEESNIPLHEDAELVQLLSQLELGDEIPRALYVTIAQVISFAYIISGKRNI